MYKQTMTDILQTINKCQRKDYLITNIENLSAIDVFKLGSDSSFGSVFKACYGKNCNYILKLIPLNSVATAYPLTENDIQKEVTMQKAFYDYNLAPKLVDAFSCDGKAYILMEKMEIDYFSLIMLFTKSKCPTAFKRLVFQYLFSKAVKLIDTAHILGLTHGDPHLQNIMINPNIKMLKMFFQMVSRNQSIASEKEARHILENISGNEYKDVYLFVLVAANDESEVTDKYIKENFESLTQDLLLYFGDSFKLLFDDFFQDPERLANFLNINSSMFIDFGQSDYIKNNKNLVSIDWSKLGGGKYKAELLAYLPDSKEFLDLFSLVGFH